MTRRWVFVAAAALVILTLLVIWRSPASPHAVDQANVAANATRDVQVQHQLVTVTSTTSPTLSSVTAAPGRTLVARTERRQSAQPASTVLARAKRALLGDGRHRPEPFPRIKNQ